MIDNRIFENLEQSKNLPQVPQVMLKLVKACSNEDTDIEELVSIISTDPALSSRLLRVIGSAYVNLPMAVTSIKTAVIYLGLNSIRNMAISTAAMHFFKFTTPVQGFDMAAFWYHSYKCGIIAEKIAEEKNLPNPDEFFLAGLLHDIGRLVLMQNFPGDYKTILETSEDEKQVLASEIKVFGANTLQVSAWLFNQWNLNPLISDAVLFINDPVEQIESALSHVKVMYISNALAVEESISDHSAALSLTGISQGRLEQIVGQAGREVDKMAKSLGLDPVTFDDTACKKALSGELKDFSLFYGTLQNLLSAKKIDSVLDVVQNGFKIVFNVERVFHFLLDENKQILTGCCPDTDKSYKIIRSIALPLSNEASILVKSLKSRTVRHSFEKNTAEIQAVSDMQIIRLLETQGMYCVPIRSPEKAFGVMVLGVDRNVAKNLDGNAGLVRLFSRQTGVCIQNLRFQNEYAADVHEKKMEAYATLTDKVIHEINNPISIVKNYIETLKLKLPDKHPTQGELSGISQEMNRMAGLLGRMRHFSKPGIESFESVDVNELCQTILDILKKSILLPKHIETQISIDPEIPDIKTDPDGIKQVFINLVKNAAEAMTEGGKISIKTRLLPGSEKIMIDEKKKLPGNIEIIFSDNGPGIDEKVKKKLFEPYTTTKIGARNSGLGLSIVHSIVKELNGTIVCHSEKGRGTRFAVTLPVSSSRKDRKNCI
jgi:signal transduction histidine kinase/HD-like signal output (HDOD) protein